MNRMFQRPSSFSMGPPTAAMMPSPLRLRDVKGKSKADSQQSDQQHVMGSLDAALHRLAHRRQSKCASCSDQKSVQSLIEMRRAPRGLSQSLTLPQSQDDLQHRRTKSNDVNLFTIKWNNRPTMNRRESIEFEGDFDEIDWDSDADDTSESNQLSRTLSALEQASSFRSLSWNPCDNDDDASQSSMRSSSSTVSKSRGRRPRHIRSGSITKSSSKAMEYMQQRSCLQQSLLRVKNKKPRRRHSSDEVSLSLIQLEGKEPMQRRMSRKKSDRSKEESDAKSHSFKQSSQDSEKSLRSSTTRSTKTYQHESGRLVKDTKTDKKEQSKLHSRLQGIVKGSRIPRESSRANEERTAAKKSDMLRYSKPVRHRRSSSIGDSCNIRNLTRNMETGPLDPTPQQKERNSASQQRASAKCFFSRKITDILAVPNLIDGDDSPRKSTRRNVVVCTKNRI
ncbi:hypothetical protein FisN_11Lh321 [Fistulifera solaris]|uniref:Uncharacterized protein n=1 Tax=Fistulifera solaris TaxID=1519565 RepID=A0A1Z5K0H6_FISSO|nr:hypothetical protein FisN_11Lh321 [Fistulifera solaris]|eukprot:GAX19813.1 hypothetical protein FisN_11Lh321 [Fistulifera solaris]